MPVEPPALKYWSFDPEPYSFPLPGVALLPRVDLRGMGLSARRYVRVGSTQPTRKFRRGRYALHEAFRLAGVGPNTSVLIPAYHCRTMLDPAIVLGANIVLYPLTQSLAPDFNSIERLVLTSSTPVRAVLATHFFGFPQTLTEVAKLCRSRGIVLVEDCAHALFNDAAEPRLGRNGDYAVCSPYKFMPCDEGGALFSLSGAAVSSFEAVCPPIKEQARSLRNVIASSLLAKSHPREPARAIEPSTSASKGDPWQVTSRLGPSPLYCVDEQLQQPTLAARLVELLCSPDRIGEARRRNYALWTDAAMHLPRSRPFIPELPSGVVPYVFPLLIDRPERDFVSLKQRGLPIWRWDDLAVSDCEVSRAYRLRLLQLPCHQSLTNEQLTWMFGVLRSVLSVN